MKNHKQSKSRQLKISIGKVYIKIGFFSESFIQFMRETLHKFIV